MAAFVRKFRKFPLVINAIGTEVYMAKKMKQSWAIKFAAESADLVTAVSSTTAQAVHESGYKKEIPIIFNGVDTVTFNPKNDQKKIRDEYSLGKKPVILSIGRMIEGKGQTYLVEAMKKVSDQFPDATLLLLGKGPLEEELKEKAKSLGVEKNIIFAGNHGHDRLPFFYAACDIFVIPSITDSKGVSEGGQGLTTKEAMATGKCVIGTRCGGIPDIVLHEQTGLLVDQKSSDQIADAIIRLIKEPELRKKLSDGAYRICMERASWDGITDAYLKHYSGIIQKYKNTNPA
jgi:glycosyltransferase involved in cell wall biosynthesis